MKTKRTTALTAIATSAFLYVPSMHASLAVAEESAGSAVATGVPVAVPVAIAVVSAAAVAGAVKVGLRTHERRQAEQERYSSWIQGNLTGTIDWDSLSEGASEFGLEPVAASSAESVPPMFACSEDETLFGGDSNGNRSAAEKLDSIDDLESFRSKDSTVNELLSWGGIDSSASQATGGQASAAANAKANASVARPPRVARPAFRAEYTSGGTYIPRHAGKQGQSGSNMANNTFINNLEFRYSDILGDVRNPWREEPCHLANPVAARLDMIIPLVGSQAPAKADAEGAKAPAQRSDAAKPVHSANVENHPAASLRYPEMTADDKVEKALANRKSLADAAAEIARVGKISAMASAATATALRGSGAHAVVREQPASSARSNDVVPVKRGPGFVDVNDDTFVRSGAAVASSAGSSRYTLRDNLPVADGRSISCTDSISDFACNIVSKTYRTQGDMVMVEYSQSPYGWSDARKDDTRASHTSDRNRSRSFASSLNLRPAAALGSLPLV